MFEFKTRLAQISPLSLLLYYVIVAFTGFILYRKNAKDVFSTLLFLMFYEGFFNYLGVFVLQLHKIVIFIFAVTFFLKNYNKQLVSKNDTLLFFVMLFFSISFLVSYYYNPVSFNFAFSQYFKYLLPVIILIAFNHAIKQGISISKYYNLLILLFKMQIFYSIIKILLIGFNETIIGSVNLSGGSVATFLPVFAFLLIWLKNEKNISKKNWVFILSTLLIAIVSNKRAIWFLMPVFVTYFYYFLGGKISTKRVMGVLFIVPLIFYFGIRFNPSLNKEGEIWGSFDMEYTLNYVNNYTTGGERYEDLDVGYGRGGGNKVLINMILADPTKLENMFGYGLDASYSATYDEFDAEKFNLVSLASASGFGKFVIANGYFGIISLFFLILAICRYLKEFKIRIFLVGFLIFDLFWYSGVIFNARTISVLFVLSISLIKHRDLFKKETVHQRIHYYER